MCYLIESIKLLQDEFEFWKTDNWIQMYVPVYKQFPLLIAIIIAQFVHDYSHSYRNVSLWPIS